MTDTHLEGATVVFDLDGTLIDTAPDLIHAVNHALGLAGYDAVPPAAVRPFIAFGGRRMLEESIRVSGLHPDADEVDDLFQHFLDHYAANIAVDSKPYPGLLDVLEHLDAHGARMGVCTNKREDLSRQLLAALGMDHYFGAIVGRDTLSVYKPHPGHVTTTIERAGGRVERAVMIGDSTTDTTAAKAAGVPVVAVSFGYPDQPVEALGGDVLIHDYGELLPELRRLLRP